jgi:hypothetical protein
VSAHSQGVPTTLAALGLLDAKMRKRIAILTYGNPTGMLYGRYFPDYFDADQLTTLAGLFRGKDHQARWVGLWRLTDWTGGYVLGPPTTKYLGVYLPMFKKGRGDPLPIQLSYGVREVRLPDPDPGDVESLTPSQPLPGPYGHSLTAYLHSSQYAEARAKLARAIPRLRLLRNARVARRRTR